MPADSEPTSTAPAAGPSLARRVAVVLAPTYAMVLLSFALPAIPLDGALADLWVRVADTGYWTYMPFICLAVVIMMVSRPGLGARRRGAEAAAAILAMLLTVAGNAALNENVIKPAFAVPRPNIEMLSEAGALGPEIDEPAEFYALGDKQARREFLAPRLEQLEQPALSDLVEAHWAHETGYSFPSGHSTAAMTFASLMAALGLLWLGGWRQRVTTVVLPVWALAVVYSRVFLGVHTPADVSVGSAVGFGWGLLSFAVVRAVVERLAPTTSSGEGPTPR